MIFGKTLSKTKSYFKILLKQKINDIMHISQIFIFAADCIEKLLFFEILHVPFLVLWLGFAGLFFTLKLGFPNITMFKHALRVIFKNRLDSPKDPGEITTRQALFASISSIVGLGNIAGVAVAVAVGGPGAIVWMMIIAFFGMSTVFAEAALSHKYRHIDKKGNVIGGPFRYLRVGLAELGYKKLGIILSGIFSLTCALSGIGGSAIFQTHEAISALTEFKVFQNWDTVFAGIFTILTVFVMVGGVKRLSKMTDKILPVMTVIYLTSCLVILIVNIKYLPATLVIMLKDAFAIRSVKAGLLGTIVTGVRRSVFSNEAGLGVSPTIYAASKSKEPIRQASVALMNPFIDTIVFCFMTGLVIVITDVYNLPNIGDGVILTKAAFSTVCAWFPIILTIAIVLFAVSTIISYGYYTQSAWVSIFGRKFVHLYSLFYCLGVYYAHQINFDSIIKIADTFVLSIAIPNLIGVYMLSGVVKREFERYIKKMKKCPPPSLQNPCK